MSKLVFASTISAIEQSDVFMTVKARICEAPEANLNGARVTEAFIDEIVNNEARYVGLPLYADKKALISGNYNRLGHLYDIKTGEFHSAQIGSFYKFEKQSIKDGCALIGYARIPKRNKKLSKAILELFSENALKFSFEVTVGEYEELDDNTILIDVSENNYLEGTAIVTYPACEDAVALELVAQQKADETRKDDEEMAEVENKAEVVETEATQSELAEEKKAISEEETAEQEETASEEENASKEEAACNDKKKKNAEEEIATVYVTTTETVKHETHAYDSETDRAVHQEVEIQTTTTKPVDGELVVTDDGVHVAENEAVEEQVVETVKAEDDGAPTQDDGGTNNDSPSDPPSEEPGPTDEPVETPDVVHVEDQKKTAEQMIAELMEVIIDLKSEIAELKEKKTVTAEINPFMDTLKTENKYSLLEQDEKVPTYSLLSM